MRTLCDKKDLCHFEGCSKRTMERRIMERTDFPKPVVGDHVSNTRLQWYSEDVILWYEKHPDVLRHARVIVEHALQFERVKHTRQNKPGTVIVPPHLRKQTAKKEKEQADKLRPTA